MFFFPNGDFFSGIRFMPGCRPGPKTFPILVEEGAGTKILAPGAVDRIPVSQVNSVTGEFEYGSIDNPTREITVADAGKALVVDSASNPNDIKFTALDLAAGDDATKGLLNQTGVLSSPEITIVNANTIRTTSFKAVFYDSANPSRIILDISAQDLVINKAGRGQAGDDVTYIVLATDGSFVQGSKKPTVDELILDLYLAEIEHPGGGFIEAVRPLFTFYGNIQRQLRQVSESTGINSRNFDFSFSRTNGAVSQTGIDAHIIGYNISSVGDDRNRVAFNVQTTINVEYFSFNPADVVPALTDFRKTYNVDDPTNETSAPIPNNDFGIIVLFVSISGKYLVVAPQKVYTSFDDANGQRIIYTSAMTLPERFREFSVPVATAVVEGSVSNNPNTTFDILSVGELAFNGGAFASHRALPNPSTGTAGQLIAVDNAAGQYYLEDGANTVDVSVNDQFLTVESNQFVAKTINAANPIDGLFMGSGFEVNTWTFSNGIMTPSTGNNSDLLVSNIDSYRQLSLIASSVLAPNFMLWNSIIISDGNRYPCYNYSNSKLIFPREMSIITGTLVIFFTTNP